MLFPLEKNRVKLGTVLIEIVLSGDYIYIHSLKKTSLFLIEYASEAEIVTNNGSN